MDVKEAGKRGGNKTLEKRGRDYFKELSLKAVKARQEKRAKTKQEEEKQIIF